MAEKLYQHIIKEQDVKNAYTKRVRETLHIFKEGALFEGVTKEYTPKEDGGQPLEKQEKEVVTTVPTRLGWTATKVKAYLDHQLVRDRGNMKAEARLEVDGMDFGELPALFLLTIENQMVEVRKYYDRMPTLDLSKKWEDTGRAGIVKNGPVITYRTAKKTVPVEMSPATERHPAQIKDVVEDVHVGTFQQTNFSGRVHPQVKANCLERIDRLIIAAKKARMEANRVEIELYDIGEDIFKYIHSDAE